MLKSGSAVAQRKLCWERPTKALVDQTDRQGWFSKSDFGSVSKRHCLYAMIHSWKHQSAKLNMLLLPWGLVGESPLLLLCYQLGIVEQVAGFNLSALGVLAVVPGGKQSDVPLSSGGSMPYVLDSYYGHLTILISFIGCYNLFWLYTTFKLSIVTSQKFRLYTSGLYNAKLTNFLLLKMSLDLHIRKIINWWSLTFGTV